MKQMIVMVSMITLGIFIFNLVAGPSDDSILNGIGKLWQAGLDARNYYGA